MNHWACVLSVLSNALNRSGGEHAGVLWTLSVAMFPFCIHGTSLCVIGLVFGRKWELRLWKRGRFISSSDVPRADPVCVRARTHVLLQAHEQGGQTCQPPAGNRQHADALPVRIMHTG